MLMTAVSVFTEEVATAVVVEGTIFRIPVRVPVPFHVPVQFGAANQLVMKV